MELNKFEKECAKLFCFTCRRPVACIRQGGQCPPYILDRKLIEENFFFHYNAVSRRAIAGVKHAERVNDPSKF